MKNPLFLSGLAPAVSLVLCLALQPLIIHVANRKKLFDQPDERKIHKTPIPRLGGIGVFWGFILTFAIVSLIAAARGGENLFTRPGELMLFSASLVVIHFTGLLDDFKDIRARYKLLAQISAALLLILGGFYFKRLPLPGWGPLELEWFGPVLTFIWYIGIINAINLIDGMDGLSGSTMLVGSLFFAAYTFKMGYHEATIISLALVGGILAFLFFNLPPASIFLGDSGSLLLGLMAGVIPLLTPQQRMNSFALPVAMTLFFVPLMDTVAAIIRRKREGRSIQSADRGHIHHKLLGFGLKTREALSAIIILEIVIAMAVILHSYNPQWFGLPLYVSWGAGTGIFLFLHMMKQKKWQKPTNR